MLASVRFYAIIPYIIGKAVREIGGHVQIVRRIGQQHDVIPGGQRVASGIHQAGIRGGKAGQQAAIVHAQGNAVPLVGVCTGADLVAVDIDSDPLVILVDDHIKGHVIVFPAAGVGRKVLGGGGHSFFWAGLAAAGGSGQAEGGQQRSGSSFAFFYGSSSFFSLPLSTKGYKNSTVLYIVQWIMAGRY